MHRKPLDLCLVLKMKLSAKTSSTLDNFRVPLALGVLFTHAFEGLSCYNSVSDSTSSFELLFYFLLKICTESIPPLIVPGFFLLSGFLFFLKWKEEDGQKVWDWTVYKEKLYKRIFTLLIPYIIWNLLPVVLGLIGAIYESLISGSSLLESARLYLQGKGFRIFWSFYNVGMSDISLFGIPLSINTAPFNYPLYYLRDLMGICIASPLLFWCIRKFKYFFILFLILLGVIGYLPSYPGLRSSALLYFSIGAFFSINNLDIVEKLRGRFLPCFILSSIILYLIIIEKCPTSLQFIYVLVGLLTLMRFVDKCVSKYSISVSQNIIDSVFFIYAAHEGLYALQEIQRGICSIIPSVSYSYIFAQYIIIICLTFAVCILLRLAINKWLPNIGRLLGA